MDESDVKKMERMLRAMPADVVNQAAEVSRLEGNKAFLKRDYEYAIRMYDQAVAGMPTDHRVFSNRSAAYLALNKLQEALNDAKSCVKYAPEWAKGYYRLGSVLLAAKDYGQAISVLNQGLKFEPDSSEIRAKLSHAIKMKSEQDVMESVTSENAVPSSSSSSTKVDLDVFRYAFSYIASTSERYSSAVGLVKPTTDRLRGVIAYLQRVRMLNSPKRHWTFWKSILSKSNAYIDMVHKASCRLWRQVSDSSLLMLLLEAGCHVYCVEDRKYQIKALEAIARDNDVKLTIIKKRADDLDYVDMPPGIQFDFIWLDIYDSSLFGQRLVPVIRHLNSLRVLGTNGRFYPERFSMSVSLATVDLGTKFDINMSKANSSRWAPGPMTYDSMESIYEISDAIPVFVLETNDIKNCSNFTKSMDIKCKPETHGTVSHVKFSFEIECSGVTLNKLESFSTLCTINPVPVAESIKLNVSCNMLRIWATSEGSDTAMRKVIQSWRLIENSARDSAFVSALTEIAPSLSKSNVCLVSPGIGPVAQWVSQQSWCERAVGVDTQPVLLDVAKEIGQENGCQKLNLVSVDIRRLKAKDDDNGRFDLFLFENIDVGCIGEGVLPLALHAKQHLSRPKTVMMPYKVSVYAVPVCDFLGQISSVNISQLNRYLWHPEYSALHAVNVGVKTMSDPVLAFEWDFSKDLEGMTPQRKDFPLEIHQDGTVNAVVFYYVAHMTEKISFSTAPTSHTIQAVQYVQRLDVKRGDSIRLSAVHNMTRLMFAVSIKGVDGEYQKLPPYFDEEWLEEFETMSKTTEQLFQTLAAEHADRYELIREMYDVAAFPALFGVDFEDANQLACLLANA